MALVTCANADVLSGRIAGGLRGAWTAELALDTQTLPSGAVTIAAAGGLSLAGTIDHGGLFLDAAHVWIVGGAGGLQKPVAGAYQAGQLRDPLAAIMAQSGEVQSSTIAAAVLAVQLPRWTLGQSTAARALDELAAYAARALGTPIHWRVLADGSIWMGEETWPAVTLPEGDDILERFPAASRIVIGPQTPSLLPGVDLADVGRVTAVEHWLEASEIRTWAFAPAALDLQDMASLFRARVRAALGLGPDPGAPPVLDRLAQYRAEVVACASDGSTVDVQPEDPRVVGEKNVPVRVGTPGEVAVVQPGAIVLLGWERGDPSRPYAVPSWEAGATVTKLVLNALSVYLVGESGAELLALGNKVFAELQKIAIAFNPHTHPIPSGNSGTPSTAYSEGDPSATATWGK